MPRTLSLRLAILLLPPWLGAACCTEETPPGCDLPYLGDEAAPMELELFALGEDLLPHELSSCGPVDIVEPPQGGRVLFVGVRAANLDPCDAKMSGALRDPTDESILGLENRSTVFRALPARPGWGETSPDALGGDVMNGFRYVANIPVCPNMSSSPRDIQQQVGLVEIHIADKRGKKGKVRVRVMPRCAQPVARHRAMCECLCQANYTIEKCGNVMTFPESPDAGACYPPDLAGAGPDLGGPDLAVGSADDGSLRDGP